MEVKEVKCMECVAMLCACAGGIDIYVYFVMYIYILYILCVYIVYRCLILLN